MVRNVFGMNEPVYLRFIFGGGQQKIDPGVEVIMKCLKARTLTEMGDMHDSEIRKRKLIAIAAVSAVVSTVTAAAYVLQDFPEEPHGKKTRNLRAVNYKVERVNKTIDKISKSVDPLYFANKLYTQLMKVDGFSSEYLDSAYQILAKDHVEAEIFLARNVEFRKKMLEGLCEKIGNL